MPGLIRAADLETLRRRIVGATRERVLRELAEALDLLTTQQPLVLVHPEYDSAHSVQGGAGAQVLKRFFETDEVSFSACSLTLPLPEEQCGGSQEVRRAFSSFTEAAEENGVSRILVGYHFRKAVEEGIKHGRKIGNRAVNLFLRPVH